MLKRIQGATGAPRGFSSAGLATSIKTSGEKDLGLIYSSKPCIASAVFTQNKVKAAPVLLSKKRINNDIHGIIVNSGNANACTGEQGMKDAYRMTEMVEQHFELPKGSVLVCSTGIIGVNLPMNKVEYGINKICKNIFKPHQANDTYFSEAIMTTDKKKKEIAVKLRINNELIKIGASVKGSGMICPNMATMLGFITTDANISRKALDKALKMAVEDTFNSITVDGEMSTNDAVIMLANKSIEKPFIDVDTEEFKVFADTVHEICDILAKQIVKDGEGASKFITLKIKGASSKSDAKKIAHKIANSLLFKTACFGMDPNWGRILAAAGSALDTNFKPDKVDLWIGDIKVLTNGNPDPDYNEPEAAKYLKKKDIDFILDLKIGKFESTIYTTDISFEYVRINSAYKT